MYRYKFVLPLIVHLNNASACIRMYKVQLYNYNVNECFNYTFIQYHIKLTKQHVGLLCAYIYFHSYNHNNMSLYTTTAYINTTPYITRAFTNT